MKSGVIYCFTNVLDNKNYVGQTSNPNRRYNSHRLSVRYNIRKTKFEKALAENGFDNFRYRILKVVSVNKESLYKSTMNKLEGEYIALLDSINNGYNVSPWGGGKFDPSSKRGIPLSADHKLKIGNSSRGKPARRDLHMGNNPKAKKLIELDQFGNVVKTYDCGKEASIKYNINYSSFKGLLKKGGIKVGKNTLQWYE